ncbi:MAG TPA: fatty acid desaturase [Blastocatellia bacterium]|jgi:fatty acid desaturase|nr:fatty acid desaturase [Blastocatellia bacterium]
MLSVGEEIDGMDLRRLMEVNTRPFQIKLLILVPLTAAFAYLASVAPGSYWVIPSIFLGLMYAHAVELQHQCLHKTAFKGKPWNRRVGVLLGLPLLVSYSDYQTSHMKHHKLLGTPEDKEFFNYGYDVLTNIKALIPHLFMVRHYRDVAGFIWQSVFGKIAREANPRAVTRIRNEYRLMAVFLLAMLGITIGFETTLFLKLWLVPLLIGVPTHALIELPEHIGCNVGIPDVLKNTRTIRASSFGTWFTDGNNYHVEHHWLPGVPNDKFPELHKYVVGSIETLETSYWSFYKGFLNQLYHHAFGKKAEAEKAEKARSAKA